MIKTFEGEEEARQFIIRREILRAIASHTCPEIYHSKPNTFSFLLLLADEMQFWGRPTFEAMSTGIEDKYIVTLVDFSPVNVEFQINYDSGNAKNSMAGFFKTKVDFFKKILRIAVASWDRNFTFKFTINDARKDKFEFIAAPKSRPMLKINDEIIEYKDLQKIVPIMVDGVSDYKEVLEILKEKKIS